MSTKNSYNLTAKMYAENVASMVSVEQIEEFLESLPKGAKIIDIGCGPGRDASIFANRGFKVVGIDFSSGLLEIAKKNVPDAEFHEMDIEAIAFPEASFQGAWANASLLHIPKNKILSVLSSIYALLTKDGCFYISVKMGSGEGIEQDNRYGGVEKFWSFFQEEEIKQYLVQAGFTIVKTGITEKRSSYDTHPFIRIFCKKV